MMNFTGIALPQTASQLVVPLANANNPIVLLTLGVLFKPAMDRMQVQAVAKFIGVKYGLGLLSAAVCTLFIPQSFALARGVIAALCVMPVPSIVMQYSAEHENDGQLAAAIVLSSQAMTLVLICCFAVVAPYIVSIDKFVFSGALLAGAVAVGVASAVGVLALKPSRVDKAKSPGVAVAPTASMRSTSPRNIAHRRQRRDVTVNIAVNAPLRALTARGSSFTSAKRSAPQAPLRAALSGGVKLVGL
jgi:hypothetical protein